MIEDTWPPMQRRWRALDPVFVRGMQRSGTSITARGLHRIGIIGFGEGHLWFEALRPFRELRDPSHLTPLRDPLMALGDIRAERYAAYLGLAIDRFHRDHLDPALHRWLDKSPGHDPVTVAPELAHVFPRSQFLFLHRNPIAVVASGLRMWGDSDARFESLADGWRRTMSAWRDVRPVLEGRFLELAQAQLAQRPGVAAARICAFLDAPSGEPAMAAEFRETRALSSFPDRAPGDYEHPVQWSKARRDRLAALCADEMDRWGYRLDFDAPGGQR